MQDLVTQMDERNDEGVTASPLSLYCSHDRVDVQLRPPYPMPGYHWHSHVEINVPFDGDVEYIVNGKTCVLRANHIGLFWAVRPHQLVNPGGCQKMGIINIPINLFLAWPLSEEMLCQITNGAVLESEYVMQVSEFEFSRWSRENTTNHYGNHQLVMDEIALMMRRVSLNGWNQLIEADESSVKKYGRINTQYTHVWNILEYIARNYDTAIKIQDIATHIDLHPHYVMNLFQKVMRIPVKQYVTNMRINHARALLSDTDYSITEIAMTVGFTSVSRFYPVFQKMEGITPGEFRNKIRSERPVYTNSALKVLDKKNSQGGRRRLRVVE